MATFDTITLYITSATSKLDKIAKYDAILEALEMSALKSAENQDIEEYWLDDGQTKIKSIYRDPLQIVQAIETYTKLRQLCLNSLNGNVVRLVDFNSNCTNRRR